MVRLTLLLLSHVPFPLFPPPLSTLHYFSPASLSKHTPPQDWQHLLESPLALVIYGSREAWRLEELRNSHSPTRGKQVKGSLRAVSRYNSDVRRLLRKQR